MKLGGDWIVDVDIRKYFDTIDHGHLREILKRRVRDGVILRLIGKWLERRGARRRDLTTIPEEGTPQGGVISPLFANIYLHEVLDKVVRRGSEPRLKGQAFLVRYADDALSGIAREEDARRMMEVLPKRIGKYGLDVHPEKTRLIDFRDIHSAPGNRPDWQPGSFDLLGFTHFWARSRRETRW